MEDAEYWYRKAMDKGNPTATRIYRRIQSMEQKETNIQNRYTEQKEN